MKTNEFVWKNITWIVRLNDESYRDKAHIGGPWSSVSQTLGNKSIDVSFRRALKKAMEKKK